MPLSLPRLGFLVPQRLPSTVVEVFDGVGGAVAKDLGDLGPLLAVVLDEIHDALNLAVCRLLVTQVLGEILVVTLAALLRSAAIANHLRNGLVVGAIVDPHGSNEPLVFFGLPATARRL